MKLPIILAYVFFIIAGIVANIYVFKLGNMAWIGLMLVGLIFLTIIGTFVGKARRKSKGIPGEPNAFIFPDSTAKKMKKMDLGIQYEASVISSALLMLGIVLFLIYFIFFTQSSWIMKGLIIFNSVCGMGLMGGMLVTYYQQLVAYRESTQFLRGYAQKQQQQRMQPRVQQRPQPKPQQPVYRQRPYEQYAEEEFEDIAEEYEEPYYDNTIERRNYM